MPESFAELAFLKKMFNTPNRNKINEQARTVPGMERCTSSNTSRHSSKVGADMRESRSYGSVRGAISDGCPYRKNACNTEKFHGGQPEVSNSPANLGPPNPCLFSAFSLFSSQVPISAP